MPVTKNTNVNSNSQLPGGEPGLVGLDPRSKILLSLGFILTLSFLPHGEFLIYALLLMILYIAAFVSGCSPLYLAKRSLIALPFALAAITLLFTVPGETLFTIPALGLDISTEGMIRFASIVTKSWISVQAAIFLVVLTGFADLMWGLQALHTPSILTSIASFTYRYLDVLKSEAFRLRTARNARSPTPLKGKRGGSFLWRARVTGWMVGSLMMRSIERSDRIYNAMLARGYRGKIKTLNHFELRSSDYWSVTGASLTYLVIVLATYYL